MDKYNYKSQAGAVSAFVMVSMAFLLVTIVGIYMISSKRAQTQIESLNIVEGKYYTEGEEHEKYSSKIATTDEVIPIYTKEQLWSIGENKKIEIEGKIYDFSTTELSRYELKNDIVINIETDLENSKFKDNLVFGINNTITKNNYDISYYYNEDYYIPVQYSDGTTITNLSEVQAVLSASGDGFSDISTITTGLTGKYYLFGYKNLSEDLGYVTDGLMVHYDGIKNTATGHKSDVTIWKDLSGNGKDSGNIISDNIYWNEDGLQFKNTSDTLTIASESMNVDIKNAINSNQFTMQFLLSEYEYNEGSLYPTIIWSENDQLSFYTDANNWDYFKLKNNTNERTQVSKSQLLNTTLTIVFDLNNSILKQYVNSNIVDSKTISALLGIDNLYLNRINSNNTFTINNLKIYNRALTDEEVMKNYEIDKIRFGIE